MLLLLLAAAAGAVQVAVAGRTASSASSAAGSGLRAQYFNNAVLLGEPACTAIASTPAALHLDAAGLREICGGNLSPELFSARMHGQLHLPPGQYQMKTQTSGALRFWVHGWKLVDEFMVPSIAASETIGKYNFTVVRNATYPVRIDTLFTSLPATIQVSYRRVGTTEWNALEPAALSPTIDPNEQRRQDLQHSLSRGWNTWHRASATAHVHLPSAFGFDITIEDPAKNMSFSKGIVDRCLADPGADGISCRVRPHAHTFNGSFTYFDQTVRKDLKVAVKSAHTTGGNGTIVCLFADGPGGGSAEAVAQLQVHATARYYFDCAPRTDSGEVNCGTITTDSDGKGLRAHPVGLPAMSLRALGTAVVADAGGQSLTMRMTDGVACLVATPVGTAPDGAPTTIAASTNIVSEAEQAVEAEVAARYPREKVGASRDVVDALRSVMGWNTMYDHRATVITPVSRSFGSQPFEMWLWDTYFSTLLAAESSKELAYTNLIEITRPTVAGNVPGFRTAVASVQDRSKPFVGALVLEQLYGKFQDRWIVELLFDDLLMWTNWIRDKRLEGPANLVVLGSDNVAQGQSDRHQCTKEAVIWESGLDNSPMYDETEVTWEYPSHKGVPVGTSCRFHLYDAGMTGLYLSMLDSLSNLAEVIDRKDDAAELRDRHTTTSAALNKWLWNESMAMYTNIRSRGDNGTSTRVSPFNFHAMLSGAASVSQARAMVTNWLLTDDGFCLTADNENSFDNDALAGMRTASAEAASLSSKSCNVTVGMDAGQPAQQVAPPRTAVTAEECCAACTANAACEVFALEPSQPDTAGKYQFCWLLKNVRTMHHNSQRAMGIIRGHIPHVGPPPPPTPAPPKKHLGCKFGVPSIAHNDTGYDDQSYWRGRSWCAMHASCCHPQLVTATHYACATFVVSWCQALVRSKCAVLPAFIFYVIFRGPMNYLVYRGLIHPKYQGIKEVQTARKRLAKASTQLLLGEWLKHGHVHENYNAATGEGNDVSNSNPFYHWGALTGLIGLVEDGLWDPTPHE